MPRRATVAGDLGEYPSAPDSQRDRRDAKSTGSQVLVHPSVAGMFATPFLGTAEITETFKYFQAHTYLGSDASDRIALANEIAGRGPTDHAVDMGA
jgi:hypothetical protein